MSAGVRGGFWRSGGLGFHHGAEGVATEGALLVQVATDFGKRGLVQCFVQQRPVADVRSASVLPGTSQLG